MARQHKAQYAYQCRKACYLGYEGEQGCRHGWRALVNIRGVKMKRHGGDPESQTRDDHDQGKLSNTGQARTLAKVTRRIGGHQGFDGGWNVCRTAQAIEVAEAEQQQGRRKDAQKEVLEGGLLRRIVMPGQIKEHVGWNTDHLERQEERHQLVGGSRQADSGDDQQ